MYDSFAWSLEKLARIGKIPPAPTLEELQAQQRAHEEVKELREGKSPAQAAKAVALGAAGAAALPFALTAAQIPAGAEQRAAAAQRIGQEAQIAKYLEEVAPGISEPRRRMIASALHQELQRAETGLGEVLPEIRAQMTRHPAPPEVEAEIVEVLKGLGAKPKKTSLWERLRGGAEKPPSVFDLFAKAEKGRVGALEASNIRRVVQERAEQAGLKIDPKKLARTLALQELKGGAKAMIPLAALGGTFGLGSWVGKRRKIQELERAQRAAGGR